MKYNKLKLHIGLIALIIFINVIMSVASIVSDSDGSAFITKAEFESLKNDFNSQVDSYNMSIDNKIDGAISSYLAGIDLAIDPINLYENYENLLGIKPIFVNSNYGMGSAANKGEVKVSVNREQAVNKYNNLGFGISMWTDGGTRVTGDACLYFNSAPSWDSSYSSWTTVWRIAHHDFTGARNAEQMAGALTSWSYWDSGTTKTNAISSYNAVTDKSSAGEGEAYIYQTLNGGSFLKFYDSSIYPKLSVTCDAHRYINCASLTPSYYTSDNGKKDTTDITVSFDKITDYGTTTIGTKLDAKSTSNGTYSVINLSKAEVNDSFNYMNYIIATGSDLDIYCIDEDASVVADDSQVDIQTDTTYFYDVYYTGVGANPQKNDMSGVKLQYYPVKYNVNQYKINSFYNYYVTNIAGERVYNGEGFPLLQSQTADSDVEVKFKLTSDGGDIIYRLSDKKFIDGAFDNLANIRFEDRVTSGTEVTRLVEGLNKDVKLWINCYSTESGKKVTIENFKLDAK